MRGEERLLQQLSFASDAAPDAIGTTFERVVVRAWEADASGEEGVRWQNDAVS